jgi:hypothetical protein
VKCKISSFYPEDMLISENYSSIRSTLRSACVVYLAATMTQRIKTADHLVIATPGNFSVISHVIMVRRKFVQVSGHSLNYTK